MPTASTSKAPHASRFAGLVAVALALAPSVARADEPAPPVSAPLDAPYAPGVAPYAPPPYAPGVAPYAPYAPIATPTASAPASAHAPDRAPREWHMRSEKLFYGGLALHGLSLAAGAGAIALAIQSDAQSSAPGHGDGAGVLSAFGAMGLGVVSLGSVLAAIPLTIIGSTPGRASREAAPLAPAVSVGPGRAAAVWRF